jgi:D-alanyl-D-alanine dipeptidase
MERSGSSIRIIDKQEPLVDVKKYCSGIVIDIGKERLKIEKTAYLRRSVAKMLGFAKRALPDGMNFIIGDAWRPPYIQTKIYFGFIERFGKKHPNWDRKKILEEVNKYVAPSKGIDASGHMSGGAIDLRIIDKNGNKVPMKRKKLSYQQNALSDQKLLPVYIRKNREILFFAMKNAGFSNYPKEYWHWSYGDYFWAKRNGKNRAFYGTVDKFQEIYNSKPCPCGSGMRYGECHIR